MISSCHWNFQSLKFSDWCEGTFYTDYNPKPIKKKKEEEQKPFQYPNNSAISYDQTSGFFLFKVH